MCGPRYPTIVTDLCPCFEQALLLAEKMIKKAANLGPEPGPSQLVESLPAPNDSSRSMITGEAWSQPTGMRSPLSPPLFLPLIIVPGIERQQEVLPDGKKLAAIELCVIPALSRHTGAAQRSARNRLVAMEAESTKKMIPTSLPNRYVCCT
jgi:hypothetical protein